jgi:hypothetical protein
MEAINIIKRRYKIDQSVLERYYMLENSVLGFMFDKDDIDLIKKNDEFVKTMNPVETIKYNISLKTFETWLKLSSGVHKQILLDNPDKASDMWLFVRYIEDLENAIFDIFFTDNSTLPLQLRKSVMMGDFELDGLYYNDENGIGVTFVKTRQVYKYLTDNFQTREWKISSLFN